jgi:GT2 family glycosyltransferase
MSQLMGVADPNVAIVVLNYNGLDDTRRCLESLRAISYPRLSVVLVDNASADDPTAAARRCLPGVVTIRNGANLGYAGGNNRGIQSALSAGADYVIVLNNDTVVAPTLVADLLAVFRADDMLGIVGPVVNYLDEPERVMTEGVRFNRGPGTTFFTPVHVPLDTAPGPQSVSVDVVNGCCMMVNAEVFRSIGFFDEALFIVHEESDFCLRARARGFGCAVLGRTLVWHKGSSAFDRSGRQIQRYFDTRNLYYLLRRHAAVNGGRPWKSSFVHYLRYAYYRYATEIEAGRHRAARAVVEGLSDALVGVTGPYATLTRRNTLVVRTAFSLGRFASDLKRRITLGQPGDSA